MKNKKNLLIIIGIIILVNLGLFAFFRSKKQIKLAPALPLDQSDKSTPSAQQSVDQPDLQQDLPPADQSASTNSDTVTISGVLIGDGNPWTVIFDDPTTGAPAATFELVFNDSSLCDFGQGDTSCIPMYFEVGTGIEITGQKDGSQLIVSQISRAVNLMPPQ
ncbi:hypothetical protein KKE45_03960 [Patescibacteria group bacterium]|nr:hypothetical protein [Patescibacteria group bacterium]